MNPAIGQLDCWIGLGPTSCFWDRGSTCRLEIPNATGLAAPYRIATPTSLRGLCTAVLGVWNPSGSSVGFRAATAHYASMFGLGNVQHRRSLEFVHDRVDPEGLIWACQSSLFLLRR